MSRHTGKHGVKHSMLGGIAVFVVVALTGFLLATNIRVNRTATVTSDTAQMVEQRVEQANKLRSEVSKLNSQINTLNKLAGTGSSDSSNSEDAGSSTVLPAVQGPGVTVTLDDSPLWKTMVNSSGSASNINDYVIHQQDIEAVVNALWAGGAEAMMIQDQRVLFNSAVICVGNVLMLQGKQYSPPYTISAIGPTEDMIDALADSQAVQVYQEYVSAFGLGWNVETKDTLKFPESPLAMQPLKYATATGNGNAETENSGGSSSGSEGAGTGSSEGASGDSSDAGASSNNATDNNTSNSGNTDASGSTGTTTSSPSSTSTQGD